jgi:hypothetical protein
VDAAEGHVLIVNGAVAVVGLAGLGDLLILIGVSSLFTVDQVPLYSMPTVTPFSAWMKESS